MARMRRGNLQLRGFVGVCAIYFIKTSERETVTVHTVTAWAEPCHCRATQRFIFLRTNVDAVMMKPQVASIAGDPFAVPRDWMITEATGVDVGIWSWVGLNVSR